MYIICFIFTIKFIFQHNSVATLAHIDAHTRTRTLTPHKDWQSFTECFKLENRLVIVMIVCKSGFYSI